MTVQPFGPEFASQFDGVYDQADAFNTDFTDQFDRVAITTTTDRLPVEWRLWVRADGVDRDISNRTQIDFTCETGRDDPNELPGPGRAAFTVHTSGADRLGWVAPGIPIWLEARSGTGSLRMWRRVWTGIVADVRRRFGWRGGEPANVLSLDATGPLAPLERLKVPAGMAGAYPEQLDGVRVWLLLLQLGVSLSTVRPEAGHVVNDGLPEHAARWDAVTRTVDGANWAVFNRTTVLPAVTGPTRHFEVVAAMTLSRACIVVVNVGAGQLQQVVAAGDRLVSGAVELPADDPSPDLQIVAIPLDDIWSVTTWRTLGGNTWSTLPAAQTWYRGPDPGQSTTVTLTAVDVWRSGWDWGAVWLIGRDPTENEGQTARDHIEEVATAARGTLWEQRDGGLSWASQLSRASDLDPSLDLPAGFIVSDTESVQSMSGLVNDVTVQYGWEGVDENGGAIPRASVHVRDQGSINLYGGPYDATIDGPLRDRPSALAVGQAVLRSTARPRERLSELVTIDVNAMDDITCANVLTVPPGSLIEVEGAPAGWVPSGAGRWRGFLEGWSITGGSNRSATVTMAISEYFEAVVPTNVAAVEQPVTEGIR